MTGGARRSGATGDDARLRGVRRSLRLLGEVNPALVVVGIVLQASGVPPPVLEHLPAAR
jgi:hypothetical protein